MTQTDLKVLDDILSEAKDATAQEMDESEFFEFFAAEHVLRDEQLDAEEVESGLVSGDKGGSDGGIDSFYLLVNGKLIRDTLGAENLKSLKQNVQIDVIIIQASRQTGFTLDRLLRLKDTS